MQFEEHGNLKACKLSIGEKDFIDRDILDYLLHKDMLIATKKILTTDIVGAYIVKGYLKEHELVPMVPIRIINKDYNIDINLILTDGGLKGISFTSEYTGE